MLQDYQSFGKNKTDNILGPLVHTILRDTWFLLIASYVWHILVKTAAYLGLVTEFAFQDHFLFQSSGCPLQYKLFVQ